LVKQINVWNSRSFSEHVYKGTTVYESAEGRRIPCP
jgi:hypothetical protein